MEPYALMTNLRIFRIKYIYSQPVKINHILFCILYLLFKIAVKDSPADFNLKRYCYKSEFYNISNPLSYNVFFVFEIISSTHKFEIGGLFFNENST